MTVTSCSFRPFLSRPINSVLCVLATFLAAASAFAIRAPTNGAAILGQVTNIPYTATLLDPETFSVQLLNIKTGSKLVLESNFVRLVSSNSAVPVTIPLSVPNGYARQYSLK